MKDSKIPNKEQKQTIDIAEPVDRLRIAIQERDRLYLLHQGMVLTVNAIREELRALGYRGPECQD